MRISASLGFYHSIPLMRFQKVTVSKDSFLRIYAALVYLILIPQTDNLGAFWGRFCGEGLSIFLWKFSVGMFLARTKR